MLFQSPSVATDRHIELKGHTVTAQGRLKAISKTGIEAESNKRASVGTRLEVFFELPALKIFNDMDLFGYVRAVHDTPNGYSLAIEFIETTPHEQAIIEDFINYKKRLHELSLKTKPK
ncbi:hypothetical protein CYQ88_09060 [Hydrogenovibrio sp. SC-1]|uniref:PilZ domain-containing protein n=1 Tax=Hydrogenovibrio sp. SC-1 TaxID=2065820 RepID=UPI000C7A66EF|nr:PilZ domain-containing protein [Hydrogenovibrio sp. SC-1]PLA73866.1 hypothetical protein CYQ88_09060 [Hydrogenovibrio sp. SC-1]